MKKVLKQKYGNPDGTLHPKYSFVCGAVAGFFSGIIVVNYYLNKGTFGSCKI